MDLLWSRLLLPCMDVEQKNCYFCICHLNGLLILPSPVRAVTERGQEVRANPASTQGRTQWKIAQIHHFQCGNQWGHAEKWGLPSVSSDVPVSSDDSFSRTERHWVLWFPQAFFFPRAERFATIYSHDQNKMSDGFNHMLDQRTVPCVC